MLNRKKLIMLREANGWTHTQMLQELAKSQGVFIAPASIAGYEKGTIEDCRPSLLFALARLYDVPPEDLLISED